MDIRGRSAQGCGENIVDMVDMEDETFAISSSSAADTAFDSVIGCIEDIIMEEAFQLLQQNFMEKHYQEFDNTEENKLSYTAIFNEYVELLEKYVEQQLIKRIPSFNMSTFIEHLMEHKDEVSGDIVDILLSFIDFVAFKEMVLQYKVEKEGRSLDLSQGLIVTPLTPAASTHTGSNQLQ
ncbi:ADP-ribosylation factor-like protein 2-binding protein isoform X1 [Phyllopteryx taeniolatus]|uniref:ADP-ribosylation factor-like protein 2-binding protein isoform X1 n=2 Tax=Phyllopteryx taeniolatus TaxID=161469 RepID=UPI002AD34011|nr:ADP-ribosylation factor-like protein 2-binding protein isoform X1 [Phyllopteryx taeniolatus]